MNRRGFLGAILAAAAAPAIVRASSLMHIPHRSILLLSDAELIELWAAKGSQQPLAQWAKRKEFVPERTMRLPELKNVLLDFGGATIIAGSAETLLRLGPTENVAIHNLEIRYPITSWIGANNDNNIIEIQL